MGAVPISPGDRVTDVPHVQVNASAEYRHPLTGSMTGYLRGDAHYTSSAPGSFTDRSIDTLRHSYKLLNASVGVQMPDVDVSLGVRNLTNGVIYTGAEPSSMGFGYVLAGWPRTFELNATYQFGK